MSEKRAGREAALGGLSPRSPQCCPHALRGSEPLPPAISLQLLRPQHCPGPPRSRARDGTCPAEGSQGPCPPSPLTLRNGLLGRTSGKSGREIWGWGWGWGPPALPWLSRIAAPGRLPMSAALQSLLGLHGLGRLDKGSQPFCDPLPVQGSHVGEADGGGRRQEW